MLVPCVLKDPRLLRSLVMEKVLLNRLFLFGRCITVPRVVMPKPGCQLLVNLDARLLGDSLPNSDNRWREARLFCLANSVAAE